MEKNDYRSIRQIALGSMILAPFIPLALNLFVGFFDYKNAIYNGTIARMTRIVEDHRRIIEEFLAERKSDLEFVGDTYTFDQLGRPETLDRVFDHLQAKSGAFVDLGIFDANGVHVAYRGPHGLTGKNYGETDWFKAVRERGYYISDVFLGFRAIPHFIIAVAKGDPDAPWVIRATIDSQAFNELVGAVRIGKTGEAYIVNMEGLFQTARRSGGNLMEPSADKVRFPTPGRSVDVRVQAEDGGESFVYACAWMKENTWLLVVRQEKADAFATLRRTIYVVILISVVGGLLVIALAFFLTEHLIRRLERMDAEKQSLSQQLITAARMAELGEMAAGFAHEINNPLQIIKSEQALIQAILSDMKDDGTLEPSESLADLEESIDQVGLQVSRCSSITRAILKFGRQQEPAAEKVDLKAFIPEVTAMVEKKFSVHGIGVIQRLKEGPLFIKADPGQLQQVLLNLYNNAMDAILAKHGGTGGMLTVEARQKDGQVEIMVSDNGAGIAPENLEKVFSPFFTTKPVGQGTGLGLSVCCGIIGNMGGLMTVDSSLGQGTSFFIRLPAVRAD